MLLNLFLLYFTIDLKFSRCDFNYYLDLESDLWYILPAEKGVGNQILNFVAGIFVAEQTDKLKHKLLGDIDREVNSKEFYGCFYSSRFLEFGPPITSSRYYNKDLCGWECAATYSHCESPRTLVGVFHRTGCICICEKEDLLGSSKAAKSECYSTYDLSETLYEFNIIVGTKSTPFRVMTVCKSRTWGDKCEKRCYCEKDHCRRSTGVCMEGSCMEHYHGRSCDKYDVCAKAICINGGTCVAIDNNNYRCECSTQTYGIHCENLYDWASHEGLKPLPKDTDFDVMLDELANLEFVADSNLDIISYFGCFSSNDFMKETIFQYLNKSVYHIACAGKCRSLGKTFTSFQENPEKCFCGDLPEISITRLNKSSCPKCKFSSKHFCGTSDVRSVYTSCTMGVYLYRGKCQNRCKCLKPVPCSITTGRCPSNLCKPGYYGTTCNIEDYNYNPYKNVGDPGDIKLAHFTCFVLLIFCLYVLWMMYLTFKTTYKVLCVLPVEMRGEEMENETKDSMELLLN